MATFKYARAATRDLRSILHYTRKQWRLRQAESYLNGIEKQAQLLADMPSLGKVYLPYQHENMRVFPYEKHRLYYIEAAHGITIMHITHEIMDQESHINNNAN